MENIICQSEQLKSISLPNLNLSIIKSALVKAQKENLLNMIIKNRDWSENERYNLKSEVDNILKNSKQISEERTKIKLIFRKNDNLKEAVEIYLSEADSIVGKLKDFFDRVLQEYIENGLNDLIKLEFFLERVS
ncbi:MAG: hypothetical protein AB1668_06785 [Nanoarchaeota archaeon]